MPFVAAVSKIDFPHRIDQARVKQHAQDLFSPSFPQVERMMSAFDNTEIRTRNFCKPLEFYSSLKSFQQRNDEYVRTSLEYSVKAIGECLDMAQVSKDQVTDFIFISTTGLATPSLDALIINEMRLNQNMSRLPVFGLGCGGGVSGFSKANVLAKANPDAVVLLVAVELCSLTFLKSDFTKSNFIASSLFADGVAACIVKGDNHPVTNGKVMRFLHSQSKLYYNTLDVMGWEFLDEGFKVLFSQDIPSIITKYIHDDVTSFLSNHSLSLADVKNFIFHPGGKKILDAYTAALPVDFDFLKNTREVMQSNGNLSSATVLYVLEKFFTDGYTDGNGLMLSLGPGFSSEMVLLQMSTSQK